MRRSLTKHDKDICAVAAHLLVFFLPAFLFAQEINFETKDGRFSTTGRVVELIQRGKPVDFTAFVDVKSADTQIVVLKKDSTRTKPIPTSVLSDATLDGIQSYLRQIRLHRKNHKRIEEMLKSRVEKYMETRAAREADILFKESHKQGKRKPLKWSHFDQFVPLYLTAAAELDAKALEFLKGKFVPAAAVKGKKVYAKAPELIHKLELYANPSLATADDHKEAVEWLTELKTLADADPTTKNRIQIPKSKAAVVKMATESQLAGVLLGDDGDLDIAHACNMKLFQTFIGLKNGYDSGKFAAVQSRLMLVAEVWDAAELDAPDFSIISEEAKALGLSPKVNLIRGLNDNLIKRSIDIYKEQDSRMASRWYKTTKTSGDDSESKKIESGDAKPEVYAKAKIIVKGVIADAELSGNTAKKIKYQTVLLAIGYMSTGGLVNNGYGGKSESPDAHAEAIRILKELMK